MTELIENLVGVAELHAAEQHGFRSSLTLANIDQILDRERAGRSSAAEALVPCYGAWFGQYLVNAFSGSWVGMDEPVPPRIKIAGSLYSPLDAVSRRLHSETSPPLSGLIADLQTTQAADQARTDGMAVKQNQAYWNSVDVNSQFINSDWLPTSKEEATAALDPWLRSEGVVGKELLCLAGGGGTHGPLHAVAGAKTTVVDFSERLLSIDRKFSDDFGLGLVTHCCSIDDLPKVFESKFDIVLQPVSMCYVATPDNVYAQIARALKSGGLYIAQHKNPTSLQLAGPHESGYQLEYVQSDACVLPSSKIGLEQREAGAMEYAHSLDQLIGGVCRHGFVIEDFCEPARADAWAPIGSNAHRALFSPPYMKIKARRI